jgi:hypothetical protein
MLSETLLIILFSVFGFPSTPPPSTTKMQEKACVLNKFSGPKAASFGRFHVLRSPFLGL